MTTYEQKDNSGVLFRNDRKDSERHPDYSGNARIDGREYWLSAWIKESKNGNKFMSLAMKPKDEQPRREKPADIGPPGSNAPQRRGSMKDQLNDDIPW